LWPGQAPSRTPPAIQGLGARGECAEARIYSRVSVPGTVIQITESLFDEMRAPLTRIIQSVYFASTKSPDEHGDPVEFCRNG
jgi:hypothetical protein